MKKNLKTVKLGRSHVPVIGERFINGRQYLLLEELVTGVNGARFRAFDAHAGLYGEERRLIILPSSSAADLHLKTLHRIRRQSHLFAEIRDIQKCRDEILVVLDWVHGPTLRRYLDQVAASEIPRPSLREAFRLGRSLVHDLSRLHRSSFIIHGDLHPENLIVHRHSSRLVMIDFGSAWQMEAARMRHVSEGNRVLYAAPETAEPTIVPLETADQFVASMIVYEMLTLTVPYEGLGGKAGWPQFRGEMTGVLKMPSRLHPNASLVPSAAMDLMDTAICRGLSLSAEQRFLTSREWTDAYDKAWFSLNEVLRRNTVNRRISALINSIAKWFR